MMKHVKNRASSGHLHSKQAKMLRNHSSQGKLRRNVRTEKKKLRTNEGRHSRTFPIAIQVELYSLEVISNCLFNDINSFQSSNAFVKAKRKHKTPIATATATANSRSQLSRNSKNRRTGTRLPTLKQGRVRNRRALSRENKLPSVIQKRVRHPIRCHWIS